MTEVSALLHNLFGVTDREDHVLGSGSFSFSFLSVLWKSPIFDRLGGSLNESG